jgi:hypothetical protein
MNGYKYLMLILSLNKVIYLSCNIFFANDRWIVGLQQAHPDGLLVLRRPAADSRTEYGMYFIRLHVQHWLPLFEITNSYDTVYKWFDHLSTRP